MIAFKKREKIIIYAIGAVIFIFLIEKFFFSGLRSDIRNLRQQIRLEEAKFRNGVIIQGKKGKILQEYKEYQLYLDVVKNSSEQDIFTKFLKEIERIANESGVSVLNLNPQSQAGKFKEYKKYSADLKGEASADKVFNFLYKIQHSAYLIKLDKLSLTPKNQQADLLSVDTTISIIII